MSKTEKKNYYKKGGKDYYSRRIGTDGSRISTDIHVYRWFWCFLKVAKELEDQNQKLKIQNKIYQIKINRSHKWFKLINIDKFSKSIKINNADIKNFYGKVKRLFNNDFYPKYRKLFLEPTTIVIKDKEQLKKIDIENYNIIIFPKENSHRRNLIDLNIINKNSKEKKSRGFKPKTQAQIAIKGRDVILKRLFHTFRIFHNQEQLNKLKKKPLNNLELFNELQNQLKTNSKLEVKDEYINKYADDSIARDRIKETWYYDEYADNYKGKEIQPKKLIMRKYPYRYFSKQLKSFSRDYKQAKILIINLCNGKFPYFDRVTK
jgi:hypothetical protein